MTWDEAWLVRRSPLNGTNDPEKSPWKMFVNRILTSGNDVTNMSNVNSCLLMEWNCATRCSGFGLTLVSPIIDWWTARMWWDDLKAINDVRQRLLAMRQLTQWITQLSPETPWRHRYWNFRLHARDKVECQWLRTKVIPRNFVWHDTMIHN